MFRYYMLLMLCFSSSNLWLSGQQQLVFKPQLLCVDNNEVCTIGDINGDGLEDVVAGRLWYAAPDFVPRPLRPITLHPPEYARNNGEYLYDVNDDGWLDLISSGYEEPRIFWYENPGLDYLEKGLEWKEHLWVETEIVRRPPGSYTSSTSHGHKLTP
jgi:hypothetical protein